MGEDKSDEQGENALLDISDPIESVAVTKDVEDVVTIINGSACVSLVKAEDTIVGGGNEATNEDFQPSTIWIEEINTTEDLLLLLNIPSLQQLVAVME